MSLVATYGPVVAALLQQNFLEREMHEGLDSVLGYRRLASQETFPGRIGETMIRTRKGRIAPKTVALSPAAVNGDIDNGLTPSSWTTEQYAFTLSEYADTQNLNIMQEQATIADLFIANARNNGVQAAQSLDRICRAKLFGAYLSGNTRVLAVPGTATNSPGAIATVANVAGNLFSTANAGGSIPIDDIRGFTQLLIAGALGTPAASPNQLFCTVVKADGSKYRIAFEAAATAYTYSGLVSAITITPDATPGFFTAAQVRYIGPIAPTTGNYTMAVGDSFITEQAPLILRPRGLANHSLLTSVDTLTMSLIEDGVAYLRDNGVPPMENGNYVIILDNTSMRQIMGDPDFKLLYQGTTTTTTAFGRQQVIEMLGVTFITTTEAYIQATPAVNAAGPKVRRPIIAGGECIMQGNFEGMDSWLRNRGLEDGDDTVVMVDGIVQIVREPLDRLKQLVAMSWTWIGDFAVPSDMTANSTIIPTASGSLFKRCVVIEHAG